MMSNRDRYGNSAPYVVLVIGLVIVFIFAFEVASSRERARYEQQRTSEYAGNAEADIRRTCIGVDDSAQAECIRQVVETGNEHQRAERDLSAQQEMARWAFYMLAVSSAGLVITAVGIYYVRDTLIETRKSVQVTREIGEAQVRAYLSIRPTVIPSMEGAPLDHRRSFEVEIENAGLTPARNVNAVVYADWLPRNLPSPCPNLVRMRDGSTQADLTIAAGSSISASAETKLTDLDFLTKDTNAGPTVPHLYGIVWYNDVFGRPHRTRFAFVAQAVVYTDRFPKIGDDAGIGVALSAASEHNDED